MVDGLVAISSILSDTAAGRTTNAMLHGASAVSHTLAGLCAARHRAVQNRDSDGIGIGIGIGHCLYVCKYLEGSFICSGKARSGVSIEVVSGRKAMQSQVWSWVIVRCCFCDVDNCT